MAKKIMAWKPKGMNKDLSVSAYSPEFAFENLNLRLSTNESNTQMSWVNEKGTKLLRTSKELLGVPVGTAVLDKYLIIFTHEPEVTGTPNPNLDHIYKLVYNTDKTSFTVTQLYEGYLRFDTSHPLETLVSYESENVQKVYWTDGFNQPRLIDITDTYTATPDRSHNNPDFIFDFVPELKLEETVTIKKELGASGMFATGVIQYAFTYYHKYGQESNIFYTSPFLYISYRDRGGSPEDKVENAFRIKVKGIDNNFDYLRIYSIQRTSLNATPICKRIQDIAIEGLNTEGGKLVATYIDTGLNGDSIDPTELLYKGGESITAMTMEQKDNTLFLGNINVTRLKIEDTLKRQIEASKSGLSSGKRYFKPMLVSSGSYPYANQLTSQDSVSTDKTVPCAGFKHGDYYRLGVQFQHKTGKWSDPIYLDDVQQNEQPSISNDNVSEVGVPIFKNTIDGDLARKLIKADYKKVRAVAVFPNIQDRVSICQGIVCPTVFTDTHRGYDGGRKGDKDLYAQSSWFFRPYGGTLIDDLNGTVSPKGLGFNSNYLEYTSNQVTPDYPKEQSSENPVYNPAYIKAVEIQGEYKNENKFQIDPSFVTFHSPDVAFDNQIYSTDFSGTRLKKLGIAEFTKTLSDIDIQTESPVISSGGSGFIHKSFAADATKGIVSGLFYDDYLVDDTDGNLEAWHAQRSPVKFMVYAWNKSGSLNNDINRPADKGTVTAVLKKKVISNLRYAKTIYGSEGDASYLENMTPQLFSSDEPTILKFSDKIYRGNIDTMLTPDSADGMYFAYNRYPSAGDLNESVLRYPNVITDFEEPDVLWKTYMKKQTLSSKDEDQGDEGSWLYNKKIGILPLLWYRQDFDLGDNYNDLVLKKEGVRMKYKTTPHLVFGTNISWNNVGSYGLPIMEIINSGDGNTRFGGKSADALRENTWVPCGEPVVLNAGGTTFYYSYGDTYYQRYDCLKTYPYTREDPNQIVEIGSFMLETRTNIDGRYDRNRGQMNNLNMSPNNFNLMNPVYSQIDNFFSYKIQDEDYYKDTSFPNQITWSKTKTSGADVDQWTNITLASMLEFDGDKGPINKLIRFNDQILTFQNTGISQVLYNENVQVSSTEGVPIEIANSGKVQGKRYITGTVGCANKWSIMPTPSGLYFIDSYDKSIYVFNGGLVNTSYVAGFNSWVKRNIPSVERIWNPVEFENFVTYYDKLNQDVMFIKSDISLHYSEKFAAFTSFYNYGGTPYFNNLGNTGVWTKYGWNKDAKRYYISVWQHNAGTYCNFFDAQKSYMMTLIGNPDAQLDKVFTNLEFRASVDGDGSLSGDKFTPSLPFDSLETWNEFQHGIVALEDKNGHAAMKHHTSDGTEALKRKFRIWRCDIPRDNYAAPENNTELNIYRKQRHPMDRMRNMWLYLKLLKEGDTSSRTEIHDMLMTYFV